MSRAAARSVARVLDSSSDLWRAAFSTAHKQTTGIVGLPMKEAARAELQTKVADVLAALDAFTHPDGRIALLGDSGFDVAAEPAPRRHAIDEGPEANALHVAAENNSHRLLTARRGGDRCAGSSLNNIHGRC